MSKILFILELSLALCLSSFVANAQINPYRNKINLMATEVEAKVIDWRRNFHQYPELSNREFKTAQKIIEHLKSLNLEVQTQVAHTGVVAVLKGGKPGPVVALRADMDALPVIERVNLPFASKEKSTYNGQEVGVMHACGHDAHVAILMGVAEILSKMKNDIKGTIKFIFQPAEEGAPFGEEGGAELMVKQGVLENPKVEVVFGLHINALTEVGKIRYKPRGTLASADRFLIKVKGKQTHGANPWLGIDPIVTASQIVMGLQTIVSRQTNLTQEAAVVTVGRFQGGVRNNIIPEEVELEGTIRALDEKMQSEIHEKIRRVATNIAESAGAVAEVNIYKMYPITFNSPELTEKMLPTLSGVVGENNLHLTPAWMGAEDFSFYAREVPGFFYFLGAMPKGKNPLEAAPHHTPDFFLDESSFKIGVSSLCNLALDYLEMSAKKKGK
jgi:amidohydrolase